VICIAHGSYQLDDRTPNCEFFFLILFCRYALPFSYLSCLYRCLWLLYARFPPRSQRLRFSSFDLNDSKPENKEKLE
jgi:hypothetical protein